MLFYYLILSHLFFDYGFMVTPSMVIAKLNAKPIGPIAKHALFHTFGVLSVLLLNGVPILTTLLLSLFEFTTHLAIDIAKGKIEIKYPRLKDPKNPWTYHLHQVDQFLHLTVMYIISIVALSYVIV